MRRIVLVIYPQGDRIQRHLEFCGVRNRECDRQVGFFGALSNESSDNCPVGGIDPLLHRNCLEFCLSLDSSKRPNGHKDSANSRHEQADIGQIFRFKQSRKVALRWQGGCDNGVCDGESLHCAVSVTVGRQ